jgi:copper chaperone
MVAKFKLAVFELFETPKGLRMNQSFQVQGMTCGHCVRAVIAAVQTVDPAAEVKVDLASGQVQVQSDGDPAAIARAIVEEGYQVAA